MRTVRPLIAGTAAGAAVLGVLGLTATAQAQPASPAATSHSYSVPLGTETSISLLACPAGNTITSVTPAAPATTTVVINANKAKLAGDWLATGTTTFTVHCSGGTTTSNKVTVAAAPAENAATGVGSDTIQNVLDQFSGDYNATATGATAGRHAVLPTGVIVPDCRL